MQKRVNISIDPALHEWATAHAEADCSDFSSYVTGYQRGPAWSRSQGRV